MTEALKRFRAWLATVDPGDRARIRWGAHSNEELRVIQNALHRTRSNGTSQRLFIELDAELIRRNG